MFILLRVKLKDLLISFLTIFFLGVLEITKLMDFSISPCGTSMVDLYRPLSFNITIFTTAFDLHWLCAEVLLHFSHRTAALLILTGELQTGHRYVCVNVLRSIETIFAFTVFSYEKALSSSSVTKIAISSFWNLSSFSWFQNTIIHRFLDSHFLEIIGFVIWN